MYFYHGNEHYYLTRIFLNDKELKEAVYSNGLTENNYEAFSYALADGLCSIIEDYLINTDLSAEEFYNREYDNYITNPNYISRILSPIQAAIQSSYNKTYQWYYPHNKGLYVSILKSAIYGSIKHFFFQNRDKYLPQYDWYLINQNVARKDIMEMLFREFDKLSTVSEAIQHYQDPDDIPFEFSIFLQEITGLTMNTYGNIFTELQLRSLTKHLIEVWREKGALFSIELFFSCMGIDCDIQELWFDKRLYFNPENFNEYTKVQDKKSFGYYLTSLVPHTTSYGFSSDSVDYANYTQPYSSRVWKKILDDSSDPDETLLQLLGIESGSDIVFSYFKSNYLLINFSYIGQNKSVTKDELEVYKELIKYVLPVFIRIYYGNEYESTYGNEQWDIFKWYNPVDNGNQTRGTYIITDVNGDERPAEIFDMFDTNMHEDRFLDTVGENFVSGTRTVAEDGSEEDETIEIDFAPGDNNFKSFIIVEEVEPPENFKDNLEQQIPWSLETFNQSSNEYLNLFESSRWNIDINAYNELYKENDDWNGYIQYEYYQYDNPLESLSADLDKNITVELI